MPSSSGSEWRFCPEGVLADPLEDLDGADGRVRAAADADVTLDDRVLQPHLDRVELELSRELVEERLEREGGRRRAGRTVGAEGEAVRLHAVAADLVRLPAVRARRRASDVIPSTPQPALEPRSTIMRPAIAGERAVLARADLQVRDLRGRGIRRLEVLASA